MGKMAGTIADGAVCTAAADCKTASACCDGVSLTKSGTAVSSVKICWKPGTAKDGTQTPPTGTVITGWSSGAVYATAACAAAAGSNTLAVSAAAAATALYAMY